MKYMLLTLAEELYKDGPVSAMKEGAFLKKIITRSQEIFSINGLLNGFQKFTMYTINAKKNTLSIIGYNITV
jgi:hypothetical protein